MTFPANYPAPNLAGKQARFAISVKQVEERKLPELDEEFCKLYGVEEGGIERLRAEVQENMERELADAVKARVKKQVLDVVIWGDADQVGEKLTQVMDLGAQGITCSLPGHGHIPGRVEQLGQVASKVLGL